MDALENIVLDDLSEEDRKVALELQQKLKDNRLKKEQAEAAKLPPDERPVSWAKTREKTVGSGQNKETIQVPYTCVENTKALLEHYGVGVRYNEMSKNVEMEMGDDEVFHQDTEINNKLTWIINKANHHAFSKNEIDEHISFIAAANAYHPVRDWILSKPWDGKSRLQQFYGTVTSDSPPKEMLMRRWAIMAVAAVFEKEGIRPQGILTFVGGQGLGKTRWLESIAGSSDWVQDGESIDPHDKDSVLDVVSKWIVELGEIQATFTRTDIQALKAFITKKEDKIRPPYERKANKYARRTVFFGTVDDEEFLNDLNGNRRFWTISVTDINTEHKMNLQQLWAEVHTLYKGGERYWMTREEIRDLDNHNQQYMSVNPIVDILRDNVSWNDESICEYLSCTEVLARAGKSNPSKSDLNVASKWLKRSGAKRRSKDRRWLVYISED